MSLTPNTRLGPYEILDPLGAGGMGEVYRAKDTRLDRDVAIKVLPETLARDKERLLRFEREAKVLATLSHPNIAAIYGFEEHNGQQLLVMELAEGETLSERLRRGALPIDDSLDAARRIAEALEAAHEKGIVHRDLKPANVKITVDGDVKVLDFGLAKALAGDEPSRTDSVNSPTITADFTRPGVILGTAGYMSPEQARGRSIDKRTDIWAFGCVLFECLSGVRLFAGETATDSIGAILHKEPEWALLPPSTPPTIQLLLRRCLAKDRNKRLRDIGDARIEIENAIADPSATSLGLAQSALTAAERRPRRLLNRVLMGIALLAAGGAGVGLAWVLRPTPPLRKFEFAPNNLQAERGVSISPDGRKIAYMSQDQLCIRELDRLEPRPLPDSADARHPFWSPDSAFVGYMRHGQLWKSSVRGGASVICKMGQQETAVAGAGWGQDGKVIFATGSAGVYEVSAQGGDPRSVLEPDKEAGEEDFHDAALLPDGRAVVFVIHGKKGPDTIALFGGGLRKVLLHQEAERFFGPVYSATGHILYQRAKTTPGIWALPFSLAKLEVTGEPFLVVPNAYRASLSSDGMLVYVPGNPSIEVRIAWADRQGKILGTIGQPQVDMFAPALSPDGARVVVSAQEGEGRDLWIHDVARGTKTRFTFSPDDEIGPRWSPDGRDIAFNILGWRWAIKPADGVGPTREMGEGGGVHYTPDGKGVVLVRPGKETKTQRDLWYVPLDGESEPKILLRTPADERNPALSPDGRYLAYASDESGHDEVYLTRFPSGEGKWQVSVDGGRGPRWNPNGRELFFASTNALFFADVQTEPDLVLGTPKKLFDGDRIGIHVWRGYDVAGDGERLVVVQSENQNQTTPTITVVENWFTEFKDRR